jgi:hypothetical protein
MEEEEKAQVLAAVGAECRTSHRHPVHDDAVLSVIGQNLSVHCNVLDLSPGGCRLRAKDRFIAEARVPVEVTFKIRGLPMLLRGVIQWTDCADHFGIRFLEMSSRRKKALVEVLTEIAAFHAGELARAAGGGAAQRKAEIPAPAQLSSKPASAQLDPAQQPANLRHSDGLPPRAGANERRAYPRQKVDSTAVISLLNVGCQFRGRLVDLSLNGCRVRTDERSKVNVHTRVKTELLLNGVLFRLSGVIEDNEDQRILRIRFQEMNGRQREQLEQLIEETKEIDQIGAMGKLSPPPAQGE